MQFYMHIENIHRIKVSIGLYHGKTVANEYFLIFQLYKIGKNKQPKLLTKAGKFFVRFFSHLLGWHIYFICHVHIIS